MKICKHGKLKKKDKMKSLEERQKEWDEKYDSPNSKEVKQRPVRPSKEEDNLISNSQKSIERLGDMIKNENILSESSPIDRDDREFLREFPNGERIMQVLSHLMFREINIEIKRIYGSIEYNNNSRLTRIISLSKETLYGIAHYDKIVSLKDLHNRLYIYLEEGLSVIDKVERNLYDRRSEDSLREQNFFSRSPTGRRDY